MDYSKIKDAIEAGEQKAKELGVAVSIAIVDEHGTLIALQRMEGAITISPKFAFTKAFTAGTIGLSTDAIAKYAGEGQPYFGINSLFGGELTTIAGGLPVTKNAKVVGGVGVGGSHDVSQDLECAKVVVEKLQ